MIASGSGVAIRLKLYVMAPIWTPPNLESILFAPRAPAIGTDTIAIFPKSRLVNSILLLSHRSERLHFTAVRCSPDTPDITNRQTDGQVSNLEIYAYHMDGERNRELVTS